MPVSHRDGSVEALYFGTVRVRLMCEGHRCQAGKFDRALKYFTRWRTGYTPLENIDDRLLDAYRDWLSDEGFSQQTVRNYAQAMRAIVRELDPERCASRQGCNKRPSKAKRGTLRYLLMARYAPLRLIGSGEASIEQLHVTLNRFAEFLGREATLRDLTDMVLADFMSDLLQAGRAHTTVNQKRGHLAALWRFAHQQKLVRTLPTVRKIKAFREEPDAWSREEVGRILCAAAREEGMVGELSAPAYWRALILLIYYTGIRRSAMRQLRLADVDWSNRLLHVRPGIMKNRRGKRFKLPDDAMEALTVIRLPRRQLLLPIPWTHSHPFYRRWDRILERAGLQTGPREKLHKMRRTCATLVAGNAGIHAAMSMLGHSEAEMTDRYIDPTKLPAYNTQTFIPPPIGPGFAKRDAKPGA